MFESSKRHNDPKLALYRADTILDQAIPFGKAVCIPEKNRSNKTSSKRTVSKADLWYFDSARMYSIEAISGNPDSFDLPPWPQV